MLSKGRRGFTLIELMVVIGIIMVLAAILFPVFRSVRLKAKETQCKANLHQIAVALKTYRADYGYYPPPPFYSVAANRYVGGVSALTPGYITEKSLLICPMDIQIGGQSQAAKDRCYSSYNGWVNAPSVSWDFSVGSFPDAANASTTVTGPMRYYNFFGYTQDGADPYYYNSSSDNNVPYLTSVPTWLSSQGMRQRHYPRLFNRNAPGNTFITHCVHHRAAYGNSAARFDIILTADGKTRTSNVSQMDAVRSGASMWVTQTD